MNIYGIAQLMGKGVKTIGKGVVVIGGPILANIMAEKIKNGRVKIK